MRLTVLSLIVGVIGSVLFSIFGGVVDSVYDIWIPLVAFVVLFIGVIAAGLLFCIAFTFLVDQTKPIKKPSKFYYFLYDVVDDFLVFWSGAKVKINSQVELGEGPYFFTVNHRSKFDTMILSIVFRKYKIRFVAKTENFRIPLAGPAIYKSGFLELKRDNNREALKTVLKAIEYLKNKEFSVGICPEGTRNQNGRHLLPFRNGCFKIPLRANVPIVVTTIEGTEKIHKNFPFKRTRVYLDVLKVIKPCEYEGKTATVVGHQVRALMLENLKRYGVEEVKIDNEADLESQVA